MSYITYGPAVPVVIRFDVALDRSVKFAEDFNKKTRKSVAKQLAEFLIANGYVKLEEPLRSPNINALVFRAVLAAHKQESFLP